MPDKTSINPQLYGISFSLKQCRSFDINPVETLGWLINEAGFRRFRLMSYWDEHEKQPGDYNFHALDSQIKQIAEAGGVITLCLGARQPRWPENHWPTWAWELDRVRRSKALLDYIKTVVERYKHEEAIISYQLENEALLTNFGERSEVDRIRLRQEYALVKRLDPSRPIIMTTSTSWGIPIRKPIPDIVGFSYYHTLYRNGAYRTSTFFPRVHRVRARVIGTLHRRPVFIHELQCEPWGPANIWEMSIAEQNKSMSAQQIATNLRLAHKIKRTPIDLWGGEWWFWRLTQNDPTIWEAVRDALAS